MDKVTIASLAYLTIFYGIVGYRLHKAKTKEKKEELEFSQWLASNFRLIPLNSKVFYYKGAYITAKTILKKNRKIEHRQDKISTFSLLRSLH